MSAQARIVTVARYGDDDVRAAHTPPPWPPLARLVISLRSRVVYAATRWPLKPENGVQDLARERHAVEVPSVGTPPWYGGDAGFDSRIRLSAGYQLQPSGFITGRGRGRGSDDSSGAT